MNLYKLLQMLNGFIAKCNSFRSVVIVDSDGMQLTIESAHQLSSGRTVMCARFADESTIQILSEDEQEEFIRIHEQHKESQCDS